MVVGEASIHNIMGGMESTGGVRLHNHKRKLKQRFDIIKKLGQGTYGKVQLGINKETGQEVAIKTIKKCKIETEADLIRIRREIQIMSSVQHPNIIHIYEVFENREKMVLVMEYAAGGELYDYLSERKVLTEHEARRIFRQIATAVFYCHKHKICHRDLKLENILLDQVGNAKIADFGLSNVFDEQRLLNTFCGSPLYASPEIVKGTPYHGPEVDCWSLGVLLYTLVYGAMPFDGSNFKRLVKQISQSDYFEPKKPSPASPLIKDMLTVCPARRADIERICTHWWVNEGYEQNCLDIAEDLAAQTPVRLDLLLSLVPQSASAEKLVVGDQQPAGDVANNVSSETLVPTRCHSVGSLMELDQNNSERRLRRVELLDEEPRTAPIAGDAKRKLETTPSMDETAAAGAKRKERSRRKEKKEEPEPRTYKSASRHHSAPIPNSITEEAMDVDPTVTVPISNTVHSNKIESTAACLELIKECSERSPSKERSKTPVVLEAEQPLLDGSRRTPASSKLAHVADAQSNPDEQCTRDVESSKVSELDEEAAALEEEEEAPRNLKASNEAAAGLEKEESSSSSAGREAINLEATQREFKKLKEKALSLDSELSSEIRDVPAKTLERRRSKILETAEKFNQMASNVENEKPKKIFIPGVNVGGAKRVFERKASLSSVTTPPPPAKPTASKMIIDVPSTPDTKKNDRPADKSKQTTQLEEGEDQEEEEEEEAKKRAVDIITGAIGGKPPMQRRINESPPISPSSHEAKRLPLKIPVGSNDLRSATVSVSTPVERKFSFSEKTTNTDKRATVSVTPEASNNDEDSQPEEPKMSSKMEITLKSATLPRPRKTSKAEICLSGVKSTRAEAPVAFKSEVEAKIDAFQPQKLRTQRSEVAFPVAAAVPQANRSSSLEPESRPRNVAPKERIIPIQVETDRDQWQHGSTPPPPCKPPPMPQRSISQRSGSLSRQSTADSDTDSALGSTVGPEPIRKSPREYIIPIAVEGGGYVTPRSGSVEPESKTSTPTSANAPRSRFGRPRRMSSLLSDASEDESPFSSLHRDSEDLLQRHMHRLRSSRPSRQPPEHADSLSSGEEDDDDDDGFELLTAENLFSTLLSRVRSLTQRLNVDDNRTTGFPSSRLFGRLGSNSSQPFWGLNNKPLSRRLSESQFRHSLSREGDVFTRKDSTNPGTPNSAGSHMDIGSNTLPRDKVAREDVEEEAKGRLEQSFTPSLTRRLSRTLIEQNRRSSTRSPSASYESRCHSPGKEPAAGSMDGSTVSDQTEYKNRPVERSNSLLEPISGRSRVSPRRTVSLLDDETERENVAAASLARWYREPGSAKLRKDSFRSYRADKIQEETPCDAFPDRSEINKDNASISECTSLSICDSNTNPLDATSSLSARSYETSPTESSSNAIDYKSAYRSDLSRTFENRLLAAENLIKESKLKNLGPSSSSSFDPNLTSSYLDTDKCDKRSLISIAETSSGSTIPKRRSCIPSLRLRSGSLTREPSVTVDRRKSFADLPERSFSPEKSLLSKFFRTAAGSRESDSKEQDKAQKSKQRRISRFLRPDFFDTPREESRYAKEKEARKAAENERRKSRFMKRKNENKETTTTTTTTDGREGSAERERKREKELKNEMNCLKRDRVSRDEVRCKEKAKPEDGSRNGFLHTLEKKLEKQRSNDENAETTKKWTANGTTVSEALRERSAPPVDCPTSDRFTTVKRSTSVEELSSPSNKPNENSSRRKVSSVLGLFRNAESRQQSNGTRSQCAILGKLKRSPPKCAKPTDRVVEDTVSSATGTRIPTKLADAKSTRKLADANKSEKNGSIEPPKRSPPKEPSKGQSPTKEKSNCNEEEEECTEKKVTGRAKKTNRSPAAENGRSSVERKTRKVAKTSESNDTDGAKKKKMIRVVKKVGKKSADSAVVDAKKTVEGEKETSTKLRRKKKAEEMILPEAKNDETKENGIENCAVDRAKSGEEDASATKSQEETNEKANRSNLKLDLSKIPQHCFRNGTPKKGSPKSGSPKSTVNENLPEKLMECLSKVTHRASITGNQIMVEKPLRAKHVAELKKEVTECAKMIESHAESTAMDRRTAKRAADEKSLPVAVHLSENERAPPSKESPLDYPNELLSPMDEPESFDSWSISSAELCHARPDLHSPTSPSNCSFSRNDGNSESVIDRIRRRSFYSRFNDRRRPSLTAPPPGVNLPGSATLPRKFSFSGQQRDRGSRYATSYGLSAISSTGKRAGDKGYSLYGEDGGIAVTRHRSLDRYVTDLKSPTEHAAPVLSSSYDPRRSYLRSPTFDPSSSASRSRYHSADFAIEQDPTTTTTGYKAPLSSLLLHDSAIGFSSLPRKPKSVQYYEELLAPSTTDYSPARRSPVSTEYPPRCENGYYNGNFDLHSNSGKRTENAASPLSCDERAEQRRNKNGDQPSRT